MSKINDYMNEKIRSGRNNYDDVIIRYINGIKRPIKVKTYELYHGSPNDFNQFDDDKIGSQSLGGLTYGKGHYFTSEKYNIYGKHIYKVKVSLRKPFIVNENEWNSKLSKIGYNWYDNLRPDVSDFLSEKGYDGTIITTFNNKISEVVIYSNKDKKIKILDKE